MINIVFFGTPEFATYFLEALHEDEEIFVSAVVSQPDKPVGRKKIITPPSTKQFAEKHDIPVLQPTKLRDPEFQQKLNAINPDFFVVVAYGRIIPIDLLAVPKKGAINVHPSLLPKYRGPSPIQAAIANQEKETGVTIMLMDEHMDHGPVLAQHPMPIGSDDDSDTLLRKAANIGAPLLVETIKKYATGTVEPREQEHDQATYCSLVKKEYGEIDWSQPADAIYAQFRAYKPWPGVFTFFNGKMLKLHTVRLLAEEELTEYSIAPGEVNIQDNRLLIGTGTDPIEVHNIQPEGKPVMEAKAFINGNRNINGLTLGA